MAVLSERYQHLPTLLFSPDALASILGKAVIILDPDLIGIAELRNGEGVQYTAS